MHGDSELNWNAKVGKDPCRTEIINNVISTPTAKLIKEALGSLGYWNLQASMILSLLTFLIRTKHQEDGPGTDQVENITTKLNAL